MGEFHVAAAPDERFVWLSGELDMWSVDDFADAVSGPVRAGGAIVIDLTRLTFIDSDGIRAVLAVLRQLSGRGCLILHNPTPHVAKVLSIVGIGNVPDVHLLDSRHGDLALPEGPGAWSRTAAFGALRVDVEARLARTERLVCRTSHLRSRSAVLLRTLRSTRDVAAAARRNESRGSPSAPAAG